ncbi:MAG: ABC transporter permease [Candidatus Lokiarchaeota archaeon]
MEQKSVENLEEELRFKDKESTITKILSFIGHNIKFFLLPGSRIEELTKRELEYEKSISKRKFIKRISSPLTFLGIIILFIVANIAVFPEWLSVFTYNQASSGVFPGAWAPMTPEHPLGQTILGRDVLARIIFGARSSIVIALIAVSFSATVGTIFGIIAAYYGGWRDSIIMRIVDLMMSFPGLILAMVFVAILGRNWQNIMLAFSIIGIPLFARLIRGNVLQARELPYIQAAKVDGAGNWRIMFQHVLPNIIQPIIIAFTFNISGVILSIAAFSFLGFSDPTLIEWGNDVSQGQRYLVTAPWASLFPGIMIVVTVLGFMLLGDGLRDALDPRLKNL